MGATTAQMLPIVSLAIQDTCTATIYAFRNALLPYPTTMAVLALVDALMAPF